MNLTILYRGPLSSCNYGCRYCPFAQQREDCLAHAHDAQALERFVAWVAAQKQHTIALFFTPWGEALIHRRYQQAIAALTQLPHVVKVAIQTNLSCRLDWVATCVTHRLGIWATYHPSQVSRERFLAHCTELVQHRVRLSVGMVGMQEHLDEIETMRRILPLPIYLWVNAYKRIPNYYTADQIVLLNRIDPLFHFNLHYHRSQGLACHCGDSVVAVAGDGTVCRCHFVPEPIGNIYQQGWEQALQPRVCPNQTCGCHIGYVHMPQLQLYDCFGSGILERSPDHVSIIGL
ncbi:MAG: radical SAM protein [Chloroflexaceae bacterium]|nr:radical SAM protein [Chloroflexaceae bacterium]